VTSSPWTALPHGANVGDMALDSEATKLLKAFGLAVRRRREQLGLSQERFAFAAEIDRTYVSGVERGVRNPTVKMVARLAVALGTKPSKLFGAAERGSDR
jgi:transcriptional regulator with XRE-family HTH domain